MHTAPDASEWYHKLGRRT